ncbi:MAG: alpha/beta hydrolase [Bacteroidetes bacterium]|nr:alpha/beta hydrolase [Bacteroidota bacterium]
MNFSRISFKYGNTKENRQMVTCFILTILLIIRINSSGVEEPFLDAQGKVLPNSIAMHEDMVINGAPQRITIRGENKDNPVLLMVHGGPGNIASPFRPRVAGFSLEDIFTVCYWEQRGAGIAYTTDIPDSTITLEQIVDDGLDVVSYLKRTFKKDKIYIEGTSWGTTVSAFMVQKKPELFQAYIGVGQMANQPLSEQISYDFVMAEAQKRNDTLGINELKRIGRPPYPDKSNVEMAEACDVERLLVQKYVPMRGGIGFKQVKKMFLDNGLTFKEKFTYLGNNPEQYYPAYKILWPTCFNVNLVRDVPDWEIPVYIMHGDNIKILPKFFSVVFMDVIHLLLIHWR